MIDKKIVIGIIIFIVGGMLIYSFANPLETNNSNEKESNNVEELEDVDKEDNDEINNEVVEEEKTDSKEEGQTKTVIKYVTVPTSGGSNNNANNGTNPTPQPVVRSSETVFSIGKQDVTAQIFSQKVGQVITYSGNMSRRTYSESGIVCENIVDQECVPRIDIVLTSPEPLTDEEYSKIVVKYGTRTYTPSSAPTVFEKDSFGRVFITFTQKFQPTNYNEGNSKTVDVETMWGYGQIIKYNLVFNITVDKPVEE